MQSEAGKAGVLIVTGDTKVVPNGSGDGIYINTTGVGFKRPGMMLDRQRFSVGDKIIVSNNIGEHGLCIMANRYNLDCGKLESDCQVLTPAVEALFASAGSDLKFMRDATRGGVLGIISEIFENTPFGAIIEEEKLPVSKEVAAIAKLLGIDPMFAACEGCFTAVVSSECADECVKALQNIPGSSNAAVIGTVAENENILLQSQWGALRKVIVPAGDQLPRIC
jgi:hydrogenase expression/formation protein HypE